MRLPHALLMISVALVATACNAPHTDSGAPELAKQGRLIAEKNCAVCHAIGPTGDSPNPNSPPLRIVLRDFDIEALATDFREHIKVGNEEMPQFDFGPLGTDALMAYLLTIEDIAEE